MRRRKKEEQQQQRRWWWWWKNEWMIQPGDEKLARQFSSPASNEDNLNDKQCGDSRLACVNATAVNIAMSLPNILQCLPCHHRHPSPSRPKILWTLVSSPTSSNKKTRPKGKMLVNPSERRQSLQNCGLSALAAIAVSKWRALWFCTNTTPINARVQERCGLPTQTAYSAHHRRRSARVPILHARLLHSWSKLPLPSHQAASRGSAWCSKFFNTLWK